MVYLLQLFVLPHPMKNERQKERNERKRKVCVVSKRQVMTATAQPYSNRVPHETHPGTIGKNEMDTHADTCCAGANWKLMNTRNEICEVAPFLDSYEPVKEVMVAQCCTVWTSTETGQEYLLVCDQMLWFGSQMEHSLINPNQIREYGIPVCDNPFNAQCFGIDTDETFVPFNTTGTIVYFESRVPTVWEENICQFFS